MRKIIKRMTKKVFMLFLCVALVMQNITISHAAENSVSGNDAEEISVSGVETIGETIDTDTSDIGMLDVDISGNDLVENVSSDSVVMTAESQGDYTYTISNDTVTITGYSGSSSVVEIPSEIEGYPVTTISIYAFNSNTAIQKVIIPETITDIRYAFYKCPNLKEVFIKASFSKAYYINGAFYSCPIEVVGFGKDVTDIVISGSTLYGANVREYYVEDGNKNFVAIDDVLFAVDEETGEPKHLLSYPLYKTDISYEIPETVTEIDGDAFEDNTFLQEMTLNVNADIYINNFDNLQKLYIQNKCKDVSIYHCENLTELYVDADLSYFKAYNCGLKTIYVGKNATDLHYGSYGNKLEAYVVDTENESFEAENGVLFNKGKTILYEYPIGLAASEYVIPETVKEIGERAFYNVDTLKTITFPEKLEKINAQAFMNMNNLQEAILGEELTLISDYVFSGCSSLQQVSLISKKLKTIGCGAFSSCKSLQKLELEGNGETEIYSFAFEGAGIKEAYFGDGVGNIPWDALWRCNSLSKIYFGKNVSIEKISSFNNGLSGLQEYTVSAENTSFSAKDGVLYTKDCETLLAYPAAKEGDSYTVDEKVKVIGEAAFWNATKLHSIKLGNAVTTVESNAFPEDGGLNYIEIPRSVIEIAEGAIPETTIRGYEGSFAAQYAQENELPFFPIDFQMGEMPQVEDCGVSVWDGTSVEEIIPEGNYYIVRNAAQLAWIAQQVNSGIEDFELKTVVLAADIDLNNNQWVPIGQAERFRGNFEGNNHEVSNFTVDGSKGITGLFGKITYRMYTGETHFIRNVKIRNVSGSVSGSQYLGGVVGRIYLYPGVKAVVENCTVTEGNFSGGYTGGILGSATVGSNNSSITIKQCKSEYTGSAGTQGGIVGAIIYEEDAEKTSSAEINNCVFDGRLSNINAGGIVGYYSAGGNPVGLLIDNCEVNGTLGRLSRYGGQNAGGVISSLSAAGGEVIIRQCVNNASVYGNTSGGIVATASNGVKISQCLNFGLVQGYHAGGIAGAVSRSSEVSECYNEGRIVGYQMMTEIGGIVAELDASSAIRDSFNFTKVTGGKYTSYNGQIVSYNSGKVINCYDMSGIVSSGSDAAIAEVNFESGIIQNCYYDAVVNNTNVPFTSINYGDSSQNVVDCGGLTTAQMKSGQGFEGWSFKVGEEAAVWENDDMYNYGYPVLSSIKDKLPQRPDNQQTQNYAAATDYVFRIVNENGKYVSGAQFSFGEFTATSSEYGKIIMPKEYAGKATLTVSKEDHHTRSITYTTKDNSVKYIMLPSKNVSETKLLSVNMTYNGHQYDLLTESKKISVDYKDTTFVINCNTLKEINENLKLYTFKLVQVNKKKETVIATSYDGDFVLKNGQFTPGLTVRLDIYDKKDTLVESEKLNLDIIGGAPETGTISFGKGISYVIPDSIPFMGGKKLTLNAFELPLSIETNAEKVKIGINVKEGALKSITSAAFRNGDYKKWKKWKRDGEMPEIADNPSVSVAIVGYAEGSYATGEAKGQIAIMFSVGYHKEWQVASTPFVVTLDINGEITGGGEWNFYPDWNDLSKSKIKFNNVSTKVEPSIMITGGLGVAYIGSVYVYGRGKFGVVYVWSPKAVSGVSNMYLKGDAGVGARLFGKTVLEVPLLEGSYTIYSRDASSARSIMLLSEEEMDVKGGWYEALTDSSNYKTIAREAYQDSTSEWYGSCGAVQSYVLAGNSSTPQLLQEAVYLDAEPILESNGSQMVMGFLEDSAERDTDDKSTFVYSIYDAAAGTWSEPLPIWDDGTADFRPQFYTYNDEIYAVWENAKESIAGSTDINTISQKLEIGIARFDAVTGTFVEMTNITDNAVYERGVVLEAEDGNPKMYWVENSAGDLFATSGSNVLYHAKSEQEQWNKSQVATLENGFVTGKIGYIGDCLSYVYSFGDAQATYVKGVRLADGKEFTITDAAITSFEFAVIDGTNVLLIGGVDGSLLQQNDISTAAVAQDGVAVNGIRSVICKDDSTYVVYTATADNKANASVRIYDNATDTWSEELSLTEQEDYVESIKGEVLNDSIVFVYNRREKDMPAKTEVNNLEYLVFEDSFDVQIKEADYIVGEGETVDEVQFSATILNGGTEVCTGGKLAVIVNDQEVYSVAFEDWELAAGAEQEVEFTIAREQLDMSADCVLTFTALDAEDEDTANNVYTMSLANPELALYTESHEVGEYRSISAVVTNSGVNSADGKIVFYNYATDEILEEFSFENLTASDSVNYIYEYLIEKADTKTQVIGVKIITEDKQSRTSDDYSYETFYLDTGKLVEIESDVYSVGEEYITGVAKQTKVSDLLLNVEPEDAKVLTSQGDIVSESSYVGTGMKVTVPDTEICRTILLKGDVNGDGKINVLDIGEIQKHVLQVKTLTGYQYMAADLAGRNDLSVMDMLIIQKDILGLNAIEQ